MRKIFLIRKIKREYVKASEKKQSHDSLFLPSSYIKVPSLAEWMYEEVECPKLLFLLSASRKHFSRLHTEVGEAHLNYIREEHKTWSDCICDGTSKIYRFLEPKYWRVIE